MKRLMLDTCVVVDMLLDFDGLDIPRKESRRYPFCHKDDKTTNKT